MDITQSTITISNCFSDIDQEFVVRELQNSYWANDRTREAILLSLSHSHCYSAFIDAKHIGFMRVVTDYSTIAYLCDVVVAEEYRGQGIGSMMLNELFVDPQLAKVKWMLRTKDAHSLYEKFGFKKTFRPERYMEK